MHAFTSGGNREYSNVESVTIESRDIKNNKVTIKKGKSLTFKAGTKLTDSKKEAFPDKHVTTLRYLSTDRNIATVSTIDKKTAKITAKKKGTCTIYVYAHNGVNKAITVTVN